MPADKPLVGPMLGSGIECRKRDDRVADDRDEPDAPIGGVLLFDVPFHHIDLSDRRPVQKSHAKTKEQIENARNTEPRHVSRETKISVSRCRDVPPENQKAPVLQGLLISRSMSRCLAVVSTGCDPLDVGAVKPDIGQFPIAQLGQLSDIALIVTERLDSTDK